MSLRNEGSAKSAGPTVAIIPARGGSKRIPRKNIQPLDGRPLVAHTIGHARAAEHVDLVYVSTEDPEVAEISRSHGAQIIERPASLASDTTTSEAVLLHALDCLRSRGIESEIVVLLQCTSPLRASDDVDRAIDCLRSTGADSLLSASEYRRFLWTLDAQGSPCSLNYDYRKRRRTQDLDPQYQENGSIYVFKPWVLETFENRLGGKIAIYVMSEGNSLEIDSYEDFELCRQRLRTRTPDAPSKALDRIQLLVVACDGVSTALPQIPEIGLDSVVLSSERDPELAARCRDLGIPCRQGVEDKAATLRAIANASRIEMSEIAYLGSLADDLRCFRLVGCSVAPADAPLEVRSTADWVLTRASDCGALAELSDVILAPASVRGGTHGKLD
ncbi:MAG: cytidylyltransferase domain-containing protein [Myxococcota bacterium]